MSWSLLLLAICESAKDDAAGFKKRAERVAEKKREEGDSSAPGVTEDVEEFQNTEKLQENAFRKLWNANKRWVHLALVDAVDYAKSNNPRPQGVLKKSEQEDEIANIFYSRLWPALKGRGWKEDVSGYGGTVKTFVFNNNRVSRVGMEVLMLCSVKI